MESNYEIDLQKFRTEGSKVFTGRDRGSEVRYSSKIDELEQKYEHIKILIPNDIRSINPSFLEEFLMNVVTKLRKDGFYKKFEFVQSGRYDIKVDLEEAVDRILRDGNALA